MITAQGTSGFCYDHSLQQTIKEAKEMSRGEEQNHFSLVFCCWFLVVLGFFGGFFCVCLFGLVLFIFFFVF